jgi:hypothetical protein
MKLKVNKEGQFQTVSDTFAIKETTNGYTLAYSVDGTNWTEWNNATDADKIELVNGKAGLYYKLVGNTDDDVEIIQ